jgi:hypothetical protein
MNNEKFCQKKAKSIDSKTRKNQEQYQAKAASANFSQHAVPINGFAGLSNVFHDVLMLLINFILKSLETVQNEFVTLEKRHESARRSPCGSLLRALQSQHFIEHGMKQIDTQHCILRKGDHSQTQVLHVITLPLSARIFIIFVIATLSSSISERQCSPYTAQELRV